MKIPGPEALKEMDNAQLEELCGRIRSFLVESVTKTGGHLSSNLGAVELTVALERTFDPFKDRIVFDVGHQSYVHKLLTGRQAGFETLRSLGGMSGFPKPSESDADAFIAGHASNSISVALGMARARTLTGGDYSVVCLTGDGALTGGLAFEALNDAGQSGEKLVVVLNDNGMSIKKNVGAVARMLAAQRVKPGYFKFKKGYRKVMFAIPGGKALYKFNHSVKEALKHAILHNSTFEELGFQYIGPVNGHDVKQLCYLLEAAKNAPGPVLVHVVTKKGKGYAPAEAEPDKYHGVSPAGAKSCGESFSSVFGKRLAELARENGRICAITAAMEQGTGLDGFAAEFPGRFFDVGIAEGHAVSMAAGMAKQGLVPVFAVYSSFLQRSFDMLIHDVAILGLHVVFAVDRAGLVGEDGETHHGAFDVGFLRQVPGMTVWSPSSAAELRDMLDAAVAASGPVAVRWPRGGEGEYKDGGADPVKTLREGTDVLLVGYGRLINELTGAADILAAEGVYAGVMKLGRICPIDLDAVCAAAEKAGRVCIAEEAAENGAVGEAIAAALAERGSKARVLLKNLGSSFTGHGSVKDLLASLGLDAKGIAASVGEELLRG
jgi:1-deoxy-D-xylulose-5-phosphate synthase